MRVGKNILILTLLWLVSAGAAAAEDKPKWCDLQKLGWHFYCDPDKEEPAAQPPSAPAAQPAPKTARERVAAIREELEEARAEMVLNPRDPAAVARYIALQRQTLDRASDVSDTWRRVIWQSPELDYSLERPVGTMAKRTWLDQRRAAEDRTIRSLNERYGVFFFFASNCVYCHAFSPIMRNFADKYGVSVMAVSVDGGTLPEWPEAVRDTGQMARFGLSEKPVPAVVLYDTKANQLIEVGYGVLSQQDLEERIFVLTQVEIGHDY